MARKYLLNLMGFFFVATLILSPTTLKAAGIWAKLSGKIVGGSMGFKGVVNIGIASRRGKVIGSLSTGSKCTGKVWINILFSRGGGTMMCRNGLSMKYTFSLNSRVPVQGKGRGKLADGRNAIFTISPVQ